MGSTSGSSGAITAFMGDVRSGLSPNLVMFPEKPFLPSPLINVPSLEVIDAAYQGDPDLQLVGPSTRTMKLPWKFSPSAP
jgi:hypothetical protein